MKMNKVFKGLLFLTFAVIIVFPSKAIVANAAGNIASNTSIPSSYDGRNYGYVTAVKNQAAQVKTGTCWAQGATSSAESSYIIDQLSKGKQVDASTISWNPYHLTYYAFNTPKDPLNLFGGDYYSSGKASELDIGSNGYVSIGTFASWIGPTNCNMTVWDVREDKYKNNSKLAFSSAAHLENGYVFDMAAWNYQDTNEFYDNMQNVKNMVMEFGSVGIAYHSDHDAKKGYWKNNAYQYKDSNYYPTHYVNIIGWDDNIEKNKFAHTPPGKGAWLVQNSYGTGFGQGGFFWLSYYDVTIYEPAFAFDFTSKDNFDNNYQYDGTPSFDTTYKELYGQNTAYAANAFVADSYESLEAVGFYTLEENQDYEIYVYKNLKGNDSPEKGTLVHRQKGNQKYKGFHTVDLKSSIDIAKGERYAVLMSFTNTTKEEKYIKVAADKSYSNPLGADYSKSYAKKGQSYFGSSLYALYDLNSNNTNYAEGVNVRIKAFTNEKNGLYEDSSGNILYLRDGNIDTSRTTYFNYENEWYYMKNGVVDSTFDGVAADGVGALWYLENSKVDFSKNGLYKRGNSTYYFLNGKVQSTYNGLVSDSNGDKWFVENGIVRTYKYGVFKCGIYSYYFYGGKLQSSFDGVAADAAGTLWYIEDGKVDSYKYGLHKRGSYTYYFIGGKVQSNYTNVVGDSNGNRWFVENGVVQTNKYGVFKCGTYSYYFIGGRVLSTFDGVASDSNGNKWYIEDGVVQTNRNGFYERGGNWYYFKGGKVFVKCCLLPDSAGTLWYVYGGKLDFTFDGVASDSKGNRWYVENGRVDTTKNGLWKRSNNWYYFKGGKLQSTYTGLVTDAAGTYWYVKSGKVDFTYNGTIIHQGWPYKVVNGKAKRI